MPETIVQIFFRRHFVTPPTKIQLFHIIGGNKAYLAPPTLNFTSNGCEFIH